MSIYRGTTPLKVYKGDMQPVNLYRGATKLAGWHAASFSGQSPLSVDCDYNVPPDALTVDGKCVQTGTPSPDSPAPIRTITGDVGITGADGASSDTATVAFGSAVCASLPDGTHDSYDAVTGVITKRIRKAVFDGSVDESIFEYALHPVNGWGKFILDNNGEGRIIGVERGNGVCNRFVWETNFNYASDGTSSGNTIEFTSSIHSLIVTTNAVTTLAAFKLWLAANPVTVYYKLATPTTVQLTPHLPVVRTGIKTLSIGADVAPTISATVKAMD